MLNENTAWLAGHAAPSTSTVDQASDGRALPAWLASGLLVLASAILFLLACASAWLSYHAQVAYVLVHNGGQATEARVWALLLDAGTAGVSVLRLYETLCRRASLATRISLLGCISASVTMNLLHSPSRTPGGFLVAAVPPLMYAVFLEHLLANLRSMLISEAEHRRPWRTFVLWINFPSLMWTRRRALLRRAAEGPAPVAEQPAHDTDSLPCAVEEAAQQNGAADESSPTASASHRPRRGRGLGPKRVAFETALAEKVRAGDLRLFSDDERERNAAAYEAAASLPAPLSRGTARRYVVQALPRLNGIGAVVEPMKAVSYSPIRR